MKRLLLVTAVAAMALSLSSAPVLQPAAHAEGMASDSKAATKGTTKSLEGAASDTKDGTTKSLQGAASDTKDAATAPSKSLGDKVGKVKTDAGKTTDSAKSLDLMGTTQGAGETKQGAHDVHDTAKEMMKNPFGK